MKRLKKAKNTKIMSREMKVKQFKDVPPSQIFYNPNTTKWFRHRYNEDLIKKSIYSLFPNNCAPMLKEEEVTPMSILLEWLSHYLKPEKKYANIWINPKYFFSKSIYDKILKLKEIFLQFDEDGSRKMEIDEMVTMFKTNHIEVTEDDLCSLFFKGKKFRKEDINKLYLDFYQFMQFALSKSSDQDFRIFMRNIKEKIMKEKANQNKSTITNNNEINDNRSSSLNLDNLNESNTNFENSKNQNDSLLDCDNNNEPIFLPMNFNLVLDYFINKGKERKSQKKIRRAIKMMKNILKPGSYPDDDKDFLPDEGEEKSGSENSENSFSSSSMNSKSEDGEDDEKKKKKRKKENEYDRQLKEINTEVIMDEFEKLFKMTYTQGSVIESRSQNKKRKKTFLRSSTLSSGTVNNFKFNNNSNNNLPNLQGGRKSKRFGTQKIEFKFNLGRESDEKKTKKREIFNEDEIRKNNLIFTKILTNKMENKTPKELNQYFYDKYHSVYVAKEETKKYLENQKKNNKKCDLPLIFSNSSSKPQNNSSKENQQKHLVNNLFGSKLKHNKVRFLY